MTTRFVSAAIVGALITLTVTHAHAVPEQLGLTARVTEAGVPITGARTFAIRIFTAATAGTQVWTENDAATAVDGLVYLTLGDQAALDATVLDGGPLWVEIQVDATVLSPRLAITSAAYAVRAGVAEDAELLDGRPAATFASSTHDHAGTYLPLGSALACLGTQKVTGLGSNGSVVCGADLDTNTTYTAGASLMLSGTQFSVNLPATTCPAGQKVSAVSASGAATCTVDVDTNTTYSAGTSLLLSGTQFSVNLPATTCPAGQKVSAVAASGAVTCSVDLDTNTTYSAGTGLTQSGTTFSVTPFTCPGGYVRHQFGSYVLCSIAVNANVVWRDAARSCATTYGGHICTYAELQVAFRPSVGTHTQQAIQVNRWMGDRMGDNTVYYINGTSLDDFDAVAGSDTNPLPGYYCCTAGRL